MNALTDIQRDRDNDAAMIGIAEARRRLEEKQRQHDRDIAMVVLGMCLTGERGKVLAALQDGVSNLEVDLVLEAIRDNSRKEAVEFFARRGVKVDAQGSVFHSLLKSLQERFSDKRVSNAIRVLNLTPRGDVEAMEAALEDVRKAIGKE